MPTMPFPAKTLLLTAVTTMATVTMNGMATAQSQPASVAVASLRDAECNRAAKCGQVGPGQLFPSLKSCRQTVAHRAARDLNAETCSAGVDFVALSQCVADLGRIDCSSFRTAGASLPSCGRSALCGGGSVGEGASLQEHGYQDGH